ncbi:MAG: phage tail protein I [Pseudomonadota bacterium]
MSDLPTLLPENRSALEVTLERATGGVGRIDPVFAWLWDPDRIPASLLSYLAWALSVDVWDSRWPEPIKREAIRNAIAIHRIKGTRKAVELAVQSVGGRAQITEWWEDGSAPHTFTVTALAAAQFEDDDSPLLNPGFYSRMIAAVTAAKPVREHFEMRVGASYQLEGGLAASTSSVAVTRRHAPIDAGRPTRALVAGLAAHLGAVAVLRASLTGEHT